MAASGKRASLFWQNINGMFIRSVEDVQNVVAAGSLLQNCIQSVHLKRPVKLKSHRMAPRHLAE